jgi:hypothetical protein
MTTTALTTTTTQTGALAVGGQFDPIVNLVLDGLTSEHSRRAYGRALTDFLTWWIGQGKPPMSKATVVISQLWQVRRPQNAFAGCLWQGRWWLAAQRATAHH